MRVFSLVSLLLGGFIGAGFASGREIANYFSVYKQYSNLAIILSSVILFLLLLLFLLISDSFTSFKCVIDKYFGRFSSIINFLFAGALLIIVGAMFAGTTVIAEAFKIDKFFVMIFTSIFAYFVLRGNIKFIDKINKILVPFILIIIVFVCMGFTVQNSSEKTSIVLAVFSSGNYMFINIATLGMFIIEIGKKFSKFDKIMASFIVSLCICIVLLIFNNAIISADIVYDLMPIISLSKSYNNFVQNLIKISVWFALVTTLISNVYVLANFMKNFIKNNRINLIVILVLGMLIGCSGFDIIVNYVYVLIGGLGMVVVIRILYKEKETKIIVSSLKRIITD